MADWAWDVEAVNESHDDQRIRMQGAMALSCFLWTLRTTRPPMRLDSCVQVAY